MNSEITARIKDLRKLFDVWKMIEYEVDDGEDKAAAQKILDTLIVSTAEEIADIYNGKED